MGDLTEEIKVINKTKCGTKTEQGVNQEYEVNMLRQAIHEQQQIIIAMNKTINDLDERISQLERLRI